MKHFLLAAALALTLCTSGLALAQQSKLDSAEIDEAVRKNGLRRVPMYLALTAAEESGGVNEVEKAVREGLGNSTREERETILIWLADRTFGRITPETINLMFFRMYSEVKTLQAYTASQLGRAEEQRLSAETALRALMVYELVGLADAARCGGDITVDEAVRKDVASRFAALSFTVRMITKEQYDLGALEAVDIEEKTGKRPLEITLCQLGKAAQGKDNYDPGTAPSTWDIHRQFLRTTYKNTWSAKYYELTKR